MLSPVFASAQVRSPPIRDGEHVRVDGTRFVVGTAPFHFVGANVAIVHGARERATYEQTLDAVVADGLSVVRVWAFGEAPADSPAWRRAYAFRFGPDGWIEESFVHLDRVLAAARARNLRVILVLANRWADYGGTAEYMRWAGQPPTSRDVGDLELARFFSCDSCLERYREHVRRVVERTNSVTGTRYRDDPTIFSWELINESYAVSDVGENALVRFVETTAAFIRERDPVHMIAAGHIGYIRARDRRIWLRIQSLPAVSYCDAHAYPGSDLRIRTARDLARAVDDRVQLAHHVVHKPFVWGEAGYLEGVRNRPRAPLLDTFLRASFRNGIAGALVWIYQPWPGAPRPHGIYVDGDGARGSLPVRRVLARHARRVASSPPVERNPALGESVGTRPLFDAPAIVRPPRAPGVPAPPAPRWARRDEALALSLDPLAFREARFEVAGLFEGGPVVEMWGAGVGWIEWTVPTPPRQPSAPTRLVLRTRISSELPGMGEGAAPTDTSEIEITLDGTPLGRVVAPVDDGIGRIVELTTSDPAIIGTLMRGRTHALRFTAADAGGAGGLCVYGPATGRMPVPPELAAELPARLELTLTP